MSRSGESPRHLPGDSPPLGSRGRVALDDAPIFALFLGRGAQHQLEPAVTQPVVNQPQDQEDDGQHPARARARAAPTLRARTGPRDRPASVSRSSPSGSPRPRHRRVRSRLDHRPADCARARTAHPGPRETPRAGSIEGAISDGAHKPRTCNWCAASAPAANPARIAASGQPEPDHQPANLRHHRRRDRPSTARARQRCDAPAA